MEPHVRLYTFISPTPQQKRFLIMLVNELNIITMLHFLLCYLFLLCYISCHTTFLYVSFDATLLTMLRLLL